MEHEKKLAEMESLIPIVKAGIDNNKEVRFIVSGNSMFPMLRHRCDSVILIKAKKLRRYDIPLYRRENGMYILHRIVKIKNGSFHIVGDNEIEIEHPVEKEQVIAVVKGFYRKGKYYSVNNILYKLYVVAWCMVLPYRYKILPRLIKLKLAIGGHRAKKQK